MTIYLKERDFFLTLAFVLMIIISVSNIQTLKEAFSTIINHQNYVKNGILKERMIKYEKILKIDKHNLNKYYKHFVRLLKK